MTHRSITLDQLSLYFHLPEKLVAQELGMCITSLKKICRDKGILRWPFRKLRQLRSTLKKVGDDTDYLSCMAPGRPAPPDSGCIPRSFSSSGDTANVCCASRLSSSDAVDTPSFASLSPRSASHTPKSAAGVHPWEHPVEALDLPAPGPWPSCTISGAHMNHLVLHHWSTLWTTNQVRRRLLTALRGKDLSFSSDGTKAYLVYTSSLAAVQAKAICEEACNLLRARALAALASPASPVTEPAPAADLARTFQQPDSLAVMLDPSAAFAPDDMPSHCDPNPPGWGEGTHLPSPSDVAGFFPPHPAVGVEIPPPPCCMGLSHGVPLGLAASSSEQPPSLPSCQWELCYDGSQQDVGGDSVATTAGSSSWGESSGGEYGMSTDTHHAASWACYHHEAWPGAGAYQPQSLGSH